MRWGIYNLILVKYEGSQTNTDIFNINIRICTTVDADVEENRSNMSILLEQLTVRARTGGRRKTGPSLIDIGLSSLDRLMEVSLHEKMEQIVGSVRL